MSRCGCWKSNTSNRCNYPPGFFKLADIKGLKIRVLATPLVSKWGEELMRSAEKKWEKVGEVVRLSREERAGVIKRGAPIGDEILGKDPRTSGMFTLLKEAALAPRQ